MQRPRWKNRLFLGLSVFGGLAVGLIICEILIRFIYNPIDYKPRLPLEFRDHSADCYPTDPGKRFPINLNIPDDLFEFSTHFPNFSVYDQSLRNRIRQSLHSQESATATEFLQQEAPYCVIYNHTPLSPRIIIQLDKYTATLGLIGDSFAFGQGVTDQTTYGHFLARKLNARIINYANIGANFSEISTQFGQALQDSKKYKFSRIIYLFVLNDPLISRELESTQAFINDLMNYRQQNITANGDLFLRVCSKLASISRLMSFVMEKVIAYRTTNETIVWYRSIFSEQYNPGLLQTFEGLGSMKKAAEAMGIAFDVVIYPLMVGMKNYPFEGVHQKIQELASSRRINTIDLLPAFRGYAWGDLIVHPVDFHPNGFAHEIAAEATAKLLR